ncbi:MAG: hypothetical protein KME45_09960 [Stenomitos rutilans HA7619-LM2]|jgi:hypothetical protein|nr:hypothetical protein [Stenomitos rutilans HA7619-LM2]
MTTAAFHLNAPDLAAEDYIVLGLATCFAKDEGEVHEVAVVEPIPSAALEAIVKGIPTSYQTAIATTLGAVFTGDTPQLPTEFPTSAQFCDEFVDRAIAAARTYKVRPVAQGHIPLGSSRSDFAYSVERKRVLNSQRLVRTEDNVKQHEYTHKVL